jgi:hypothetical protein
LVWFSLSCDGLLFLFLVVVVVGCWLWLLFLLALGIESLMVVPDLDILVLPALRVNKGARETAVFFASAQGPSGCLFLPIAEEEQPVGRFSSSPATRRDVAECGRIDAMIA